MERANYPGLDLLPSPPPEGGSVILKRSKISLSKGRTNPTTSKRARSKTTSSSPTTYLPKELRESWWPKPSPMLPCEGGFETFFCGCKAKVRRVAGCHKLHCRTCEVFLVGRRSRKIFGRLEAIREGRPVGYIVPTVPKELRHKAARRPTWNHWRRKLFAWMKKNLGVLWAVERADPAGDSKPGAWHPHFNFLVVFDAAGPCADGYIRPALLEALKAFWGKTIGWHEAADLYVDNSRWHKKAHRPSTPEEETAKVRRWSDYQARTWPDWQDSVKRHMTPRWLGKPPKWEEPDREKPCCDDCGEEILALECKLGEEEAAFWAALGPEKCLAEWQDRHDLITGVMKYRPVPERLLMEAGP